VGEELLEQMKEVEKWQQNLDKSLKDLQIQRNTDIVLSQSHGDDNEQDVIDVSRWQKTPLANALIERLLSSLQFSDIRTREERISEAHAKTFEWIFTKSASAETAQSSFVDWLKSGTGLYWITGKAGSGKSTLMKFIVCNAKTKNILNSWAGKRKPIIASFYFWNAGNEMQTSQEGLLRTLLHQAISQYRSIVPDKFPGRWESLALSRNRNQTWTWTELEQAFRFLLEEQDPSVKFCFFIDGLDEFKGDLTALIALTHRISLYSNAKICVSSRPWIIFEDAFRAKPQFMLQDLTYPDIKRYVDNNLSRHPGFQELSSTDETYAESLITNVAEKAEGVFLWVVLVVQSLLQGLSDGDHLSDLQRRLDTLPTELENLFRRILHSSGHPYFRSASAIFQIFRASISPLSLISLSFADEEDPDLAIRAVVKPITAEQKLYRALTMRRRLDSRCKGLLEITPIRIETESKEVAFLRDVSKITVEHADLIAATKVEYLHRTVKDFLQTPDVWEELCAATHISFNPNTMLTRSFLMELKWIRSGPGDAAERAWDTIFWVLKYSAKSEGQHGYQFELVDELDKAATEIFTKVHDSLGRTLLERHWLSSERPAHWSAARAPYSPDNTFLALIAQCGLTRYLNGKLTMEQVDKPAVEQLLRTAIMEYDLGYLGPNAPDLKRERPNIEIIEILLAHSDLSESARSKWLSLAQNSNPSALKPDFDNPSIHESTPLVRKEAVLRPILGGGLLSQMDSTSRRSASMVSTDNRCPLDGASEKSLNQKLWLLVKRPFVKKKKNLQRQG